MAARLEWDKHDLNLGAFNLAYVSRDRISGTWKMMLLPVGGSLPCEKERYQNEADCMQDCEAEVRRLLRESGVVVDG